MLQLQFSKEEGFLGLNRLIRRLVAEDGFPDKESALRAIADYENFFRLGISYPLESFSPSQAVDLIWQRHMLDTRAYMQDCDRLAGKYIHRFNDPPLNAFEKYIQLLGVSNNITGVSPTSSYLCLGREINIDNAPYSSDLETENLLELVNQVRVSFQRKSSSANIAWIPEYLEMLESDSIQVIEEYKRFLQLLIINKIVLTPSKLVDEFWHQHILNSTEYFQFCIRIAGHYIHHSPHDQKPHSFHLDSFNQTQQVYKKYFGLVPPEKIWSHVGTSCGGEPEPIYLVDSPTSVILKLCPRSVNKEHYIQLHPVFKSKGMSTKLWKTFVKDVDSVRLMSWEEYINLEENSCWSWIKKGFFHIFFFAIFLIPSALGYTEDCGNGEVCIDFSSYLSERFSLTKAWFILSFLNFLVIFLEKSFLKKNKLVRKIAMISCIACYFISFYAFLKEGIVFLIFGFFLPLCSLMLHFVIAYANRRVSKQALQEIMKRYTYDFSKLGILITLSDSNIINIEANL